MSEEWENMSAAQKATGCGCLIVLVAILGGGGWWVLSGEPEPEEVAAPSVVESTVAPVEAQKEVSPTPAPSPEPGVDETPRQPGLTLFAARETWSDASRTAKTAAIKDALRRLFDAGLLTPERFPRALVDDEELLDIHMDAAARILLRGLDEALGAQAEFDIITTFWSVLLMSRNLHPHVTLEGVQSILRSQPN